MNGKEIAVKEKKEWYEEVLEKATLPENFESLSVTKQKDVIVSALQESQIQVVQMFDAIKDIEIKAKKLNDLVNHSKEMKELKALRTLIKEQKKMVEYILAERNGMLRLTKKIGFDVTKEMKKLKQVNS